MLKYIQGMTWQLGETREIYLGRRGHDVHLVLHWILSKELQETNWQIHCWWGNGLLYLVIYLIVFHSISRCQWFSRIYVHACIFDVLLFASKWNYLTFGFYIHFKVEITRLKCITTLLNVANIPTIPKCHQGCILWTMLLSKQCLRHSDGSPK